MCKDDSFEIYYFALFKHNIYNCTFTTHDYNLSVLVFLLNRQTCFSNGLIAWIYTLTESDDAIIVSTVQCHLEASNWTVLLIHFDYLRVLELPDHVVILMFLGTVNVFQLLVFNQFINISFDSFLVNLWLVILMCRFNFLSFRCLFFFIEIHMTGFYLCTRLELIFVFVSFIHFLKNIESFYYILNLNLDFTIKNLL